MFSLLKTLKINTYAQQLNIVYTINLHLYNPELGLTQAHSQVLKHSIVFPKTLKITTFNQEMTISIS